MGRAQTRQERLFRPLADLPPTRRALLAVALNPNAPEHVLLRLAALPHARAILAERDLTGCARLLDTLLAAADTATLRGLAGNPTTPWPIRCDLAERSDDARVRSAVGRTWFRAEEPEAFGDSVRLLRRLAADPDVAVRVAVAVNPSTPADAAQALARDPEPRVRKGMSWSPYRPDLAAAWRVLLTDEDGWIRGMAAGNFTSPPIPDDLADGLLLDPRTRGEALLNRRITMSDETAAVLAADPDWCNRIFLAAHPQLPATLVGALAADPSADVRAAVAVRGDISEELRSTVIASLVYEGDDVGELLFDFLLHFAESGDGPYETIVSSAQAAHACLSSRHRSLRRAAARWAPLSPEALAGLFDDADGEVACTAAERHPNPPGAVLERLAVRHSGKSWAGHRLVDHRAFPPEAWVRLAASEEIWLRMKAARCPQLPAEVVGGLARDPEPGVRAVAAGHPDLPAECIGQLLTDSGRGVAESMGESPALTVDWMHRLLDDEGCQP